MSERVKLGLLCFLFLLALGMAIFMIANAIQAMHDFQRQNNAVNAGDISTIRPWMTIHVISHIYHVPEDYLDQSLNIARTAPAQKRTLYEIAANKRQPVEQLIHRVQQTILTYRKEHPHSSVFVEPPPFGISSFTPALEGIAV